MIPTTMIGSCLIAYGVGALLGARSVRTQELALCRLAFAAMMMLTMVISLPAAAFTGLALFYADDDLDMVPLDLSCACFTATLAFALYRSAGQRMNDRNTSLRLGIYMALSVPVLNLLAFAYLLLAPGYLPSLKIGQRIHKLAPLLTESDEKFLRHMRCRPAP